MSQTWLEEVHFERKCSAMLESSYPEAVFNKAPEKLGLWNYSTQGGNFAQNA